MVYDGASIKWDRLINIKTTLRRAGADDKKHFQMPMRVRRQAAKVNLWHAYVLPVPSRDHPPHLYGKTQLTGDIVIAVLATPGRARPAD